MTGDPCEPRVRLAVMEAGPVGKPTPLHLKIPLPNLTKNQKNAKLAKGCIVLLRMFQD